MTEQEIKPCEFVNGACIHCEATEREECEGWVCPPQRPWVGLTEQERNDLEDALGLVIGKSLFDNIEAALKERNT